MAVNLFVAHGAVDAAELSTGASDPSLWEWTATPHLEECLTGESHASNVPGSARELRFDAIPRISMAISHLGTSEAVAIGASTHALQQLDR